MRGYALLWFIGAVVAGLVRRYLPKHMGLMLAFVRPARGVPVNVLAFWLVLSITTVITVLKIWSTVRHPSTH